MQYINSILCVKYNKLRTYVITFDEIMQYENSVYTILRNQKKIIMS